MNYRRTELTLAGIAAAGLPLSATACEPILPLTQLIGGASLTGPLLLMQSVTWLIIAILIKSTAFVLLERRLRWPQAIWFMLVANVLSTIPGVLAAVFAGALTLLALPIIFGLGIVAERRLLLLSKQSTASRFSGKGVAFPQPGSST